MNPEELENWGDRFLTERSSPFLDGQQLSTSTEVGISLKVSGPLQAVYLYRGESGTLKDHVTLDLYTSCSPAAPVKLPALDPMG